MNEKFIVVATEHRTLGHILLPYIVEPTADGIFYGITRMVRSHNMNDTDIYSCSESEKEIVKLIEGYSDEVISKKFSKSGKINNLLKDVSEKFFKEEICPYIDKKIYRCLQLITAAKIDIYYKGVKYNSLYDEDIITPIWESDVTYTFNKLDSGTQYSLNVTNGDRNIPLNNPRIKFLTSTPCSFIMGYNLYILENLTYNNIAPFIKKRSISVPLSFEEKYYSTFVHSAVSKGRDVRGDGFKIIEGESNFITTLNISRDDDSEGSVSLNFNYGGELVKFEDKSSYVTTLKAKDRNYIFTRYKRDNRSEEESITELESIGFSSKSSFLDTMEWVGANRDEIDRLGVVLNISGLASRYIISNHKLDISATMDGDWFDLHALVHIGEQSIPFTYFKRYIIKGIRECELPNGDIFILPSEWFSKYRDMFGLGSVEGDKIVMSRINYFIFEKEAKIEKCSATVPLDSDLEVPLGIRATLREYQVDGYRWMHHLMLNNFGGCLADDMGLGKTIQTLALLEKLKREQEPVDISISENSSPIPAGHQPASLMVLPTSLIHNWIDEINRFAPSLKVYNYTGPNRRGDITFLRLMHHYDVIVTTYGTVRNDIEMLSNYNFYYIVLDEGQNIKNQSSQIYKAILQINSTYRLVLTGTPIENSLSDLWAQLNFLNRGSLGKFEWFKREFITPIEKRGDEERADKLLRYISPFLLRRTKEEVAKDLPPITEQIRLVPMTSEQRHIYETEKSSIRNSIMEGSMGGSNSGKAILALQGLTKLRQIANHPSIYSEYDGESGKFNEAIRMLKVLKSENHRILIFSSFVSHLNLFKEKFEEDGSNYSLLTGSTSNRGEVIDKFRSDKSINYFLISLKAGGVGLNLTEADYVFVLDPWWNPAAEAQAVNRAHRIGQDKNVFVYRFITEDSIEEKILKLKNRKSLLSDKFISADSAPTSLTEADLTTLFE